MSLPTYSKMKASGVEWLGDVPEKWEVKSLKRCNQLITDRASEAQNPIALENIESHSGALLPTESEYQGLGVRFGAGDILFGKLRPYLAKVGLATKPGEAVGDIFVLRPTGQHSARYLQYQFLTKEFISIVDGSTYGSKMPRVGWDFLSNMPVVLPEPPEQRSIAAFLDRETAAIDLLVAVQRELIALLKEKRQAVISHAVTKGLDPTAPMKPSGIDWLGDIPMHWMPSRIKYAATVRGRIGFRGYTTDDLVAEGEGALVLGGTNISSNGRISLEKRTFIRWEKYEESPEIKIDSGDVLVGQRGSCGKVALVPDNIGAATINPSLVVLKISDINSQFLLNWLLGSSAQNVFDSYLNKTAIPMLSQEQISNTPLLTPPIEEQLQICAFLDERTNELDELIAQIENAIDLLLERRAALISAAVTGKIDVRGPIDLPATEQVPA
jgi:type I restriction enzyme, S subunit